MADSAVIGALFDSLAGLAPAAAAAQVLAPALTGLVAPVQAITQAFQGVTGQITGFVGAFSPATAMAFQRTLGDITAVIGQALVPVLEAATDFLKDFGATLAPILEEMKPAIASVTTALTDFAQGFLATFASLAPLIVDLANFFALLAQIVAAVARPFQAFAVVLSTVLSALTSFLGGLFGDSKGMVDTFRDAMTLLARAVVNVAARIAQAFGALGFLDSLQKAFGGKAVDKKDVTGTKAASNPTLMKFDAIGEAVARNASIATGDGGEKKKPEDWLSVIADDIKDIKGGKETFIERLAKKFGQEVFQAIMNSPIGKTFSGGKKVVEGGVSGFTAGKKLGFGGSVVTGAIGAIGSYFGGGE